MALGGYLRFPWWKPLQRLQETHLTPYLVKGRDVATRGHLKLRVASFALANMNIYLYSYLYILYRSYIYMYIYTQFTLNKYIYIYIWRETDLFYDAHKPSFCFYLFLAIEQSIEQWKLTIFYIGLSSTKQDWMCHCLNVHLRLYWVFQKRFGDDDLRPGQISTTFGSKIHSLERPRFWKWVMPYGSEVLLDFLFFKSKF